MSYDPEKYREKREKVLGIRKRGVSFGVIAAVISVIILLGLGSVTLPQVVSYLTTRHLDDAIFKLETGAKWPTGLVEKIRNVHGVTQITGDHEQLRMVVTFDRRHDTFDSIQALFSGDGIQVTLLNRLSHRQHQQTLKKEEEELETP